MLTYSVMKILRTGVSCQRCSLSVWALSSRRRNLDLDLESHQTSDVCGSSGHPKSADTQTPGTNVLPYYSMMLGTNLRNFHVLCLQPVNFKYCVPNSVRQSHTMTFPSVRFISSRRKWNLDHGCRYFKNRSRCYSNEFNESGWPDGHEDLSDIALDPQYRQMFTEDYLLPDHGHRVFVIQPDIKRPARLAKPTRPDLQLAEACALVESLPRWTVKEKVILPLKIMEKKHVYGKGNFELLKRSIRESGATAAFISINMLTPVQFSTLQKEWGVPIYDRYTMVLQIFKLRAVTREAKLQVALAEIPYYRSCLRGFHEGTLDQQRGGMQYIGGTGETFLEVRSRLLQERETKLKRALSKLRDQRQILRQSREKKDFPMVAVVGYTNAGKTSLIKALTKDSSMEPKNQLFATLDVTTHAGSLDNHMTVLYVDTVGFISDIPTDLLESFAATLEDMLNADVIVHVRDESHPDKSAQCVNVLETLDNLKLPAVLRNNIIEVANKSDLLPGHVQRQDDLLYISATRGQGLQELKKKIQEVIMITTDRIRKHLIVPMNGDHLSWLYREATVESAEPAPDNPEALRVSVVMTSATLARFKVVFGKERKRGKSKEQKF